MLNELKIEDERLSCYKELMPLESPRKGEKKDKVIGVAATASLKEEIKAIAEEVDRPESYVGWALMLRGLALYRKDKLLKGPESQPPEGVVMERVYLAKPKEAKKRKNG